MIIDGSVAIVTGASGGIGSALAQRLLEHGASVVVTDLSADRVAKTVVSLEPFGPGRVVGLATDCSVASEIQGLIDLANERFGAVDLYSANAGVLLGEGLESSESDWETSLDVNVLAHVRAARLLTPGWLERGKGYFLTTASAAGLLTQFGSPTYAVSKHAAVAFAEWMSVTYGSRGIVSSCLCPMGVNTDLLDSGANSADETTRNGVRALMESSGVLEPLEVADTVVEGIGTEQFLILPHPKVIEFYRQKGSNYDRWLGGMRRFQDALN